MLLKVSIKNAGVLSVNFTDHPTFGILDEFAASAQGLPNINAPFPQSSMARTGLIPEARRPFAVW
ncbi:hypothetical protein [Novosphingobium terrae]|uniref:hypothetical protein n=1 Tax=Novosphingobium terrae TaxID=2726189 RepID=UPI0019800E78|nr:hypothetical protein [Novosphingobium terrae]